MQLSAIEIEDNPIFEKLRLSIKLRLLYSSVYTDPTQPL